MSRAGKLFTSRDSSFWIISALIFVISCVLMAWLRLVVYPRTFVSLAYSLPLLICLWHRDRILLWAMSLYFIGLATVKSFVLLGVNDLLATTQWGMQITNILVTAIVVHVMIHMSEKLKAKNEELEQVNAELAAREEEVTRQNEELQAQGEELSQQNEELEHQSEELQIQSEELQHLNSELTQREQVLQELLAALSKGGGEKEIMQDICVSLRKLLAPGIACVAVVEKTNQDLLLQSWAGDVLPAADRWPLHKSFSAMIIEQGRTASADLTKRPDFNVPDCAGIKFSSVLGTPLRLRGEIVGVVKAYSDEPKQWTTEHFRLIEWMAGQCTLALEIARLRQQLRRLNANLEETVIRRTTELEEMVDELEHFSYTITHDMRAPLRAIQGFAGMLEESVGGTLDEDSREVLMHLGRSAQRMDRLITDALSYSKALQQEMSLHPVDAEALLRGIIYSYPVLQPPKARIHIEKAIPLVIANEAGLTQCFSNLLTNAVKFVAPGVVPEVTISHERRDNMVRMWVTDNGIGIPPQAHGRLFNMFQRVSKDYEGTGIGLALVRKVAAKMRGRVGFESVPGQGSRFWVELPVAQNGGSSGKAAQPAFLANNGKLQPTESF